MVKTIAITGGIGSGKSELRKIFENLGYVAFNADQLARDILHEQDVVHDLVSAFGSDIFVKGELQREKLRDIVFNDQAKRKQLESITHPAIAKLFAKHKRTLESLGTSTWMFYEAAVIIESNRHKEFDALILVTAKEDVRVERLGGLRGVDEQTARRVMQAQLSDVEKAKHADFIIDNSGSKDELLQNAQMVILALQKKFEAV